MNVNRNNQINGYHRRNQIKKQNMKLSETKKGGGHRYQSCHGREQGRHAAPAPVLPVEGARTPERMVGTRVAGEGVGTPGCTGTRAADGGRAHEH